MKIVFSENIPIESEYLYPYSVYGLAEENDKIDKIYQGGFISTRIDKGLFVLSRSSRINLAKFDLSSELRRIQRKTEGLTATYRDLATFTYDYAIGKWMKEYYREKFGIKSFSPQKVKWIFTSEAYPAVYEFKFNGEVIGYTICQAGQQSMHYLYPFYKLDSTIPNIGMGMMLSAILDAKSRGLEYVYLGTVYTENSLYKTQYPGFEWFDGINWTSDLQKLKEIVRDLPPQNPFMELENRAEVASKSQNSINFS